MRAIAATAFAALSHVTGCASAPGIDRPMLIDEGYATREVRSQEDDDRCGPEFIEKALPKGLVNLLEPALNGPFGPVCVRHDACYRLGEYSQAWCDSRMLTEMTDICNEGRSAASANAALCRARAGLYHSMVDSRFGAYAYQGYAAGRIASLDISEGPAGVTAICAGVENSSHILQRYTVELQSADGQRLGQSPSGRTLALRAGEAAEVCLDAPLPQTGVELRLVAKRPDTLSNAPPLILETRRLAVAAH